MRKIIKYLLASSALTLLWLDLQNTHFINALSLFLFLVVWLSALSIYAVTRPAQRNHPNAVENSYLIY